MKLGDQGGGIDVGRVKEWSWGLNMIKMHRLKPQMTKTYFNKYILIIRCLPEKRRAFPACFAHNSPAGAQGSGI